MAQSPALSRRIRGNRKQSQTIERRNRTRINGMHHGHLSFKRSRHFDRDPKCDIRTGREIHRHENLSKQLNRHKPPYPDIVRSCLLSKANATGR